MDIERWDGTKQHREYQHIDTMMAEARQLSNDPNTKTLILHFPKPKLTVPKKQRRKQ